MTQLSRETKETKIDLELEINGSGVSEIMTQIGFFDHMLDAFTRHSLCDLKLSCIGDTHIDDHHSVEDIGIAIGQALNEEIFPVGKVERFSNRSVILDEACVEVIIDLSGRPYLHYELDIDGKIGDFDCELFEEFFRALVFNAKISAHIILKRGKNRHHIAEAAFKAFGVAFRDAIKINARMNKIPSTKESL